MLAHTFSLSTASWTVPASSTQWKLDSIYEMFLSKFIFVYFFLLVLVKYKENQQKQPGPHFRTFSSPDICHHHLLLVPEAALPFDAVLLIEVLLRLKHWICNLFFCECLYHNHVSWNFTWRTLRVQSLPSTSCRFSNSSLLSIWS